MGAGSDDRNIAGGDAIAVVGRDGGLGSSLAEALISAGASVLLCPDHSDDRPQDQLDPWVAQIGRLDALVYASAGSSRLTPIPASDMSAEQWRAAFDAPLEHMLAWFQAAFPHLERTKGRIVVVQPTVGLSGAPTFMALAGLTEGQRALAKVAARQWRTLGLAVNVVAVRPDVFAAELADERLSEVWSRVAQMGAGEGFSDPPIPLDVNEDLAPLVSFLASPATRRMTGQTMVLDGATWMAP